MTTAIVIGSEGQDGTLLRRLLEAEEAVVVGVARQRTSWVGIEPGPDVELLNAASVEEVVRRLQPDEIYYLAAHHHSSQKRLEVDEASLLEQSLDVHVRGLGHVLSAMRRYSSRSRLVYASSSLVFGDSPDELINESTPRRPDSIYGITKAAGMELCRYYRERYGMHASVAILFTHESPLRGPDFLSRKITSAALAIRNGRASDLTLADLSAVTDWGWAPDYVEAMVKIARHATSDDFVVATGQTRSVQEFVECIFSLAAIDWRLCVREDPARTRVRQAVRRGDATKLRTATGWQPTVSFEQMAEKLWLHAVESSTEP